MDERLTSYLLGEMTEGEQIRLEEEFFADEEKFQRLRAAQDDLLDAYAGGQLSSAEREMFERQALSSPWMRERLELAQAITEYVQRPRVEPFVGQTTVTKSSWWQKVKNLLWPSTNVWRVAAFAAAVLLFLVGGWLMFEMSRLKTELAAARAERQTSEQRLADKQRQQTELSEERERQQSQLADERARSEQLARDLEREREERARLESELHNPSRQPSRGIMATVLSFVLTPQALRGSGEMPKLTIRPGVTSVNLRLSFDSPVEYQNYLAELQTAEGRVVSNWKLPRQRLATKGVLVLRVPAALFQTEDYLLTLRGVGKKGESELLANYSFRVARAGQP